MLTKIKQLDCVKFWHSLNTIPCMLDTIKKELKNAMRRMSSNSIAQDFKKWYLPAGTLVRMAPKVSMIADLFVECIQHLAKHKVTDIPMFINF